jgi:hypothetical protein
MVLFSWRYFYYDRIFQDYISPTLLFPVMPWLPRLSDTWMYLPFVGILLGSIGIFLGWRFRFNAWLFFVSWFYIFLSDVSQYNNHYYLILLFSFLLAITDSHRFLSLDVRRVPSLKSTEVPAWQVFVFQFQIAVVYFYGGLSKLHPQWLDGTIMRSLVAGTRDHHLFRFVFDHDFLVWVWTYVGLLFDLCVGFCLFWQPTRRWALWSSVGFHVWNGIFFFSPQTTPTPIGVFPMMGVVMCLVFLSQHTYLLFFSRLRHGLDRLLRYMGVMIPNQLPLNLKAVAVSQTRQKGASRWLLVLISCYILIQIVLPFRRMLFPDYLWTREGLLFGWNMKLSTYHSPNIIRFKVQDSASGLSWDVDMRDSLTYEQYLRVCHSPYMIWLYAQYLSRIYAQHGPIKHALEQQGKSVPSRMEVYVYKSGVALHTTTLQPLISPTTNMANVDYRYWSHNGWILPRR